MTDDSASTTLTRRPLLGWGGTGLAPGPAFLVIALAVAAKLVFFAVLDRPLGCDCGQIWAMPDNPASNSLIMLDPYTLLHMVFGALLVTWLAWMRPGWRTWTLIAVVVTGSTLWELAENLPQSIQLFNYDTGDPRDYRGDSLLNAMADTGAAALGAWVAWRLLPVWAVLMLALAVELLVSLWIGDGFAMATLRALQMI